MRVRRERREDQLLKISTVRLCTAGPRRVFDLRGVRWIALLGILNFVPLYEAITQRTVEIFELMLILAAFALMRTGRQTRPASPSAWRR